MNENTPAKWNAEYRDYSAAAANDAGSSEKPQGSPLVTNELKEEQTTAGGLADPMKEENEAQDSGEGATRKRKKHDGETPEERAERKRRKKEKKAKKLKKEQHDEDSD